MYLNFSLQFEFPVARGNPGGGNLRQFYCYFCHNSANATATTACIGFESSIVPSCSWSGGGGGEGRGGRGEEGSPIKYLYGQMLLNGGNDVTTPDLESRGKIPRIGSDDSLSGFSR